VGLGAAFRDAARPHIGNAYSLARYLRSVNGLDDDVKVERWKAFVGRGQGGPCLTDAAQ